MTTKMTSLGAVLKEEITRLSRKEIRKQVEPVRKASSAYRREIAALKRELAQLKRQVNAVGRVAKRPAEAQPTESTPMRFVAKGLPSLRERLGVSQADFGKLAGVSGQSVYNWERGTSVPRKAQLVVLAGLRSLGKREAQERLSQVKAKPKAAKPKASKPKASKPKRKRAAKR